MEQQQETSWSLIESARAGKEGARDEFARRYLGAVRAYFAARWAGTPLAGEEDDAVQEVFVDCFGGETLGRADPERPFRPFLYGVARNVALRIERRRGSERRATAGGELDPEADETRLSVAFDRAFAAQVMREAAALQSERATSAGGVRVRRVELLRLRFQEGLSVAEISRAWNEDNKRVHHLFEDALEDFREALREVVGRRIGCPPGDLERECAWMLELVEP